MIKLTIDTVRGKKIKNSQVDFPQIEAVQITESYFIITFRLILVSRAETFNETRIDSCLES